MSIPCQLSPTSGPRRALPDFTRGADTVERMVQALRSAPARPRAEAATGERTRESARPRSTRGARLIRAPHAARDVLLRSAAAAAGLGGTVASAAAGTLLLVDVDPGHAPSLLRLLAVADLGVLALVLGLLGLRFALVALATARTQLEVTGEGIVLHGLRGPRAVGYEEIRRVQVRVVHPVHWLTADLELRDGRRIVLPMFDRHVWELGAPSTPELRWLRRLVRRRR